MYHTALFKVLTEHVPLPRREKKKQTTIKTTHHPSFFPLATFFYSCNKKRLFTSSVTHDFNQADITWEYNGEPNELQSLTVYVSDGGYLKYYTTMTCLTTGINIGPRLIFAAMFCYSFPVFCFRYQMGTLPRKPKSSLERADFKGTLCKHWLSSSMISM